MSPVGLSIVWAEAERIGEVAKALSMSLALQVPSLYAATVDGTDDVPPFVLIRINDEPVVEERVLEELMARLEAVREAVPGPIMGLSETVAQAADALTAAEQRRDELKALLQGQAPILAGTAEARSIVGLHRRIARLEVDRRQWSPVDIRDLRRAYDALIGLNESMLTVEPEAARLAAQWDRLLTDEALLDRIEPRHPLTDQLMDMQAKLRQAERARDTARVDMERPRPTAADRAEIERLHALAEAAEDEAGGFGSRRPEAGAATVETEAAEAALLERFGFSSYADYIIAGAIDPPIAAFARHQAAEQKVAAIETMIDEIQANMAPSRERQQLLERADQLAAEISERYGPLEPGEDVAALLRSIRRPPQAWFDLIAALEAAGIAPTDDPVAEAYRSLSEARRHNAPVEAIDAELAEARARLGAIDPVAVARYGPLGVAAAELVHLEHGHGRLTADLGQLRAELALELERDPDLKPTLETIQALDRELTELAAQMMAEDTGGWVQRGTLADRIEQALTGAMDDGHPTVVVVIEAAIDESASATWPEMVECVDRLSVWAGDGQLIVITSSGSLANAGYEHGGPALSTFAES